ncbi:hypothetical protein K4E_09320 [Enterococcus thailandicus]|nr:hypothetical protein K4E_09320 [Enterococcus thailandicus]
MNKIYPDDSLTLHTDLYQINMMQTYWELGRADLHAVFECYFREMPFNHGYAVFAGLERLVQYLENLTFSESDIDYLREVGNYPEGFLTYLKEFEFKATVRSMLEGEIVFNNEPLIQVEGPLAHCQLVETALLNMVIYTPTYASHTNHPFLISCFSPFLKKKKKIKINKNKT